MTIIYELNTFGGSARTEPGDLADLITSRIAQGVDAVELGPTDAALCVEALRAFAVRRRTEIPGLSTNEARFHVLAKGDSIGLFANIGQAASSALDAPRRGRTKKDTHDSRSPHQRPREAAREYFA